MILRNQTASVVSRHQDNNRPGRGPDQGTYSTKELVSAAPQVPASVSRCLSQSVELRALSALFTSSTLLPKYDARLSHGHLDFLQSLYQKVAADSPLALATSWLAVLVMGFHNKGRPYYMEESQLMSSAIQHTLNATKDPVQSVQTETLAAVVLLGYGEYLQDKKGRAREAMFMIHQNGAEALIRKRGAMNFQDSTSIALFDAVRHNAVSLTISGIGPPRRNWDLWALDDEVRQLCDSYTPATELDACAVMMLSLKYSLEREDCSTYLHLQTELLQLLERLKSWPYHVPSEWFLPGTTTSQTPIHHSREVCYILNQWYLLLLSVSHLLKEFDLRHKAAQIWASDFSSELNYIDNIMASKYVLLGTTTTRSGNRGTNVQISPSIAAPLSEDFVFAVDDREIQDTRLFQQTIEKLYVIISHALENMMLPPTVTMCYQEVLSWARKERHELISP
ncbi:hypothetical protein UA08_06258 [Talaromyces atroroseus]|uniref:Transcription factor domain-containing protein n=1 Tax=Talaromyces atroroseus TaxID=1441469 RepID=A0A225AUE0_TALAT|nr:hypothetical protein UA08_06258 [Talaromyces atroroseus]OKL58556.1 hypothetical protein UA08_06258 [Talaromyces atroroseus]